jgi:hypothetical protein
MSFGSHCHDLRFRLPFFFFFYFFSALVIFFSSSRVDDSVGVKDYRIEVGLRNNETYNCKM